MYKTKNGDLQIKKSDIWALHEGAAALREFRNPTPLLNRGQYSPVFNFIRDTYPSPWTMLFRKHVDIPDLPAVFVDPLIFGMELAYSEHNGRITAIRTKLARTGDRHSHRYFETYKDLEHHIARASGLAGKIAVLNTMYPAYTVDLPEVVEAIPALVQDTTTETNLVAIEHSRLTWSSGSDGRLESKFQFGLG